MKRVKITAIETVGENPVSSGRWGEDGDYGLAEAVHSHVATSALIVFKSLFLSSKINPTTWQNK